MPNQNFKYCFFLGCLLVLFSCNSVEKKKEKQVDSQIVKESYTITGYNYSKSDSIFLLNKNLKVINKAKINEENFNLKGVVETPSVAFLKLNKQEEIHPIIIENKEYKALFSNNSTTILGGNLHQKWTDYQDVLSQNALKKSNYYNDYLSNKISLSRYQTKLDRIIASESTHFYNFIKNNTNNLLSLYLIQQRKLSSSTISKIQNNIRNTKNTELTSYLSELKEKTTIAEARAKIENRPIAQEFSGTNLNGRITSLAKVKKDKKAVLIDFWASWCGPCRVLSPKIKNLYFDYVNKGFEIVTVSQDRSINDWKLGVEEDGLENWYHVYDDDNDIAKMYGVRGIPHMVLLDEKGRIIKNKIDIFELESTLKSIFNTKN